jgi:hypothetical protein
MPVKRRLSKEREGAISPSTVAAYARALELRKQVQRGEVDLDELAESERVVERALSIRMWQPSVFDLDRLYGPDDAGYARAAELRARLEAALTAIRAKQTTAAAPAPDVKTPVLADVNS